MEERDHVITVLEETKTALGAEDVIALRQLSNQTIHSASIHQDTDSLAIAVTIYALSKIIERQHHEHFKGCTPFCKKSIQLVDEAIIALRENNDALFSEKLGAINTSVQKINGKLKGYIEDVFHKARINKASKLYEHGISREQTASLLGLTLYELAGYTGQQSFMDYEKTQTSEISKRVNLAMEMFA